MATEDNEENTEPGLRERKKRETRAALSRAAVALTVERGWDRVTVEDVAAAANVSVRTFRNYFSGKAEAIAAGHFDRMLRIAAELRARPAAEPLWESVVNAVLAEFEPGPPAADTPSSGRRRMDALRLMVAEPAVQGEVLKANAAAQHELAAAIAARTGTGTAHDLYPALVAAVVIAGANVAVERWLRADPPGSVAPLLRDVFARIEAGLPAS